MSGDIERWGSAPGADGLRRAYDSVRALLISGEFGSDERVTVRPVCEELGISPTPVRAALAVLANEGMLVSDPQRGYFVPRLGTEDVNELCSLRAHLECRAVAQVIARPNRASVVLDLREAVDRGRQLGEGEQELGPRVEAFSNFHRELIRASGSWRLLRLWDWVVGQLQLGEVPYDAKRARTGFTVHAKIVTAIEAGKRDRALSLTWHHALELAATILPNQPEGRG